MKPLHETSYEEFGKLRFLDFFPRTKDYVEDHAGGLESGVGLACYEGYLVFTCFTSPADREWQTAEICLDFQNRCPEAEGNELLRQLGLGLRKGMTYAQAKESLGVPEEDDPTYLRFVLGQRWFYYLDCFVGDREGLFRLWICRKDLADEQIKLES
jgi:hypothetical protein